MSFLFPAHNDKRKYDRKGNGLKEYMLDWARAIANDVNNGDYKTFAGAADVYRLQRLYGMNKQPVERYKTLANAGDQVSQQMMNVDFTPTGPLPKFIKMAVEKIILAEYGPVCTPIDMLSRNEINNKIAKLKSRIAVRDMLQKVDPELAENPMVAGDPGDPQDMEEMEMRMRSGDQFSRAMDAELVITAALHETDTLNRRPDWVKDLVYHGVTFLKDYLDSNGRPAWRKVNLSNFVSNRCSNDRFEDMRYAGELIKVTMGEISRHFTEAEMEKIRGQVTVTQNPFWQLGVSFPNNNNMNDDKERGQALVFDFEFITDDNMIMEHDLSKYGNPQVKRYFGIKRKEKENRVQKQVNMVYGGKWIVGTDLIYEFGPINNMVRNYSTPTKMHRTSMNYWGVADDMSEMIISSYMDRLMPLADDYMMARLNIQNIRNEMVPNGWAINEDALEDSDLTLNGQNMGKEEKIKLFMKRGILVYRGTKLDGQNGNGKPIEFMQNNIFGEFIRLYDQLQLIKLEMKDVLGLNDVTDGSTPSDRMLNGVASMAEQSTNTALRPLMRCDKWIMEKLCKRMLIRVQQAIRRNGDFTGYAPSVNNTTLHYVKADPKITEKDYDIMIEVRPSEEQRQSLVQSMQSSIEAGLIDVTEIYTILSTHNMKQAQDMLAFKVEKRRKEKHQEALELQDRNGMVQQQAGIAVEQAKQQTEDMLSKFRIKEMEVKYGFEKELLQMKLDSQERIKTHSDATKLEDTLLKAETAEGADPLMPFMEG